MVQYSERKDESNETVCVLNPTKDLLGGGETRDLERAVQECIADNLPRIVIDLGRVSCANSDGLAVLSTAHISCRHRQGYARLARVNRRIRNLFLINKLAYVFAAYPTVDDAVMDTNQQNPESREYAV
jgi:anti-anti-sigma factor